MRFPSQIQHWLSASDVVLKIGELKFDTFICAAIGHEQKLPGWFYSEVGNRPIPRRVTGHDAESAFAPIIVRGVICVGHQNSVLEIGRKQLFFWDENFAGSKIGKNYRGRIKTVK